MKRLFKMMKKSFIVVLTLFMTLGLSAGNTSVFAEENTQEPIIYDIDSKVSEDSSNVVVNLKTEANGTDKEINSITNPDGTVTNSTSTSYKATKNGELKFVVNYKLKTDQGNKVVVSSKTYTITYTIDSIKENSVKAAKGVGVVNQATNTTNLGLTPKYETQAIEAGICATHKYIIATKAKTFTSVNDLISYQRAKVVVENGQDIVYQQTVTGVTMNPTQWSNFKNGNSGTYAVTYTGSYGGETFTASNTITVIDDINHNYGTDGEMFINTKQIILTQSQAKEVVDKADASADGGVLSEEDAAMSGLVGAEGYNYFRIENTGSIKAYFGPEIHTIGWEADAPTPSNPENGPVDDSLRFYIDPAQKADIQAGKTGVYRGFTQRAYDPVIIVPGYVSHTPNFPNDGLVGNSDTYGPVSHWYEGQGWEYAQRVGKLIIVKDGSIIGDGYALDAEDGTIDDTDAMSLANQNALAPFNNAVVTLANGTTTTPTATVSAANWSSIKAGTAGTYQVTYTYGTSSKTVNLTVKTTTKHKVIAQNGRLTQSQAKALANKEALISTNNASVVTDLGATATPVVTTSDWTNIKAGVVNNTTGYEVTYSYGTGAKADSKTVKVFVDPDGTVYPPQKSFGLFAEGGYIRESQAKALTNQTELIPYNDAYVTLTSDGSKVNPNVSVSAADWNSIKAGKVARYNITYNYGTGAETASKTVPLMVIPDGAPVVGDFVLMGHSSFYTQTEAKALNTVNDLKVKNEAYAYLYKTGEVEEATVTCPNFAQIKAGVVNSYDATYSYTNTTGSATLPVKEIVIPDGSIISPEKDFALSASDGIISIDGAKALNATTDLIPVNKATVYLLDGTTTAPTTVTPSDWASIKAGTPGQYTVLYGYGTGTNYTSKTVKLTVGEGVNPPDYSFLLNAEGKKITSTQAKALANKEALISVMKAKVTLANGTSATPNVSVANWTDIKAGKEGSYDVTFSYGTGANYKEITKKLLVNDGIGESFGLKASNGVITIDQAKALANKEALIPYNKASVTLLDGTAANPNVTVTNSDWLSMTKGTEGTYDVMYSYTNGDENQSKIVKLTVYDPTGGIISPNKDFILFAHGTIINQTEAKALANKEALNTYTEPSVLMIEDNTRVTPSVTVADFTNIKAGKVGLYDAVYSYGTGSNTTTKTVKVRVVSDDDEISPNRDYALHAENATIDKEAAKNMTSKEDLRTPTKAVVYLNDGSTAQPDVATASFASIKAGIEGTYKDITFSYGTLSKNVEVKVTAQYEERMLFDYNNNGRIDVTDKTTFNYLLTNPSAASETDLLLSDANNNGRIDITDKSQLNYYLSNPTVVPPMVNIPK